MLNKKIICGISFCVVISAVTGIFLLTGKDKKLEPIPEPKAVKVVQKQTVKADTVDSEQKATYDFYSDSSYDVPLNAIVEISKLTPEAKKSVDSLLENAQGFYFIKHDKNNKNAIKVFLQNPIESGNTYRRHGLQIATVSDKGIVTYKTLGYEGENGETANAVEQNEDRWIFDESIEPKRPLRHTIYDEHGKVKFVETWNYSDEEPIKYEMKDKKGNAVSILKETINDDNYLQEHIFYDEEGRTQTSLTVNYDGANITRFTYYNAKDNSGISVMSEYQDGVKTKEDIYNKDYELQKTINAKYEDGNLKEISVTNSEGKEIENLSN